MNCVSTSGRKEEEELIHPVRPYSRLGLARSAAGVAAAALALLSGCSEMKMAGASLRGVVGSAPGPQPIPEGAVALQPLAPVRRDIYTRSYRLGETYQAKSGDTVVSVKNYAVTEKVGHATVLRDFAQTCRRRWPRGRDTLCEDSPLDSVRGAMGSVFDVVGAVTRPDGQFFAVLLPSDGRSQTYLLVDPTGRLRKGTYIAWREDLSPGYSLGQVPVVELAPDLALDSQAPLFSFESVEKFVFMGPGYLSFDLIFTGTRDTARGELITFLYREFGRDSTSMPTFERPLQFPVSQRVLELEKLRIEVEPVGYSELRFRVIADGQPAPTTR
ncbi:MAG: hypothetical protein ABR587_08950 [Candidatus Binatia bacterium]